jgi:hypothetical protein
MNLARWCRNEWERTLAVLVIGVGLVVFFLGWLGQRDKALVTEQIPYVVSGAMFGLLLVILGTTVWLSADLRDEWIKLDEVQENVARVATLLETEALGERRSTVPATSHRAPVEAQR